jgi:hypothetical protein
LDHREDKTIWKISSWRLLFLLEFMLKLAIFANQLLILALEFPLVSHARTAGAMSLFPDAGGRGVIGAWRGGELMRTALISEIVFMSGLAAGRLLSLFLDGWPSPILIAYAVAELLLAGWGIFFLRSIKYSRIS